MTTKTFSNNLRFSRNLYHICEPISQRVLDQKSKATPSIDSKLSPDAEIGVFPEIEGATDIERYVQHGKSVSHMIYRRTRVKQIRFVDIVTIL